MSDGNRWQLQTNDPGLYPWLGQLASIMRLSGTKKENTNELVFSRFGLSERYLASSKQRAIAALPEYATRYQRTSTWIGGSKVVCEVAHEKNDRANEIVQMFNALYPIYRNSIRDGGLPFHAALIEINGRGVLLAAPGGTGKSTCCRRVPAPWKAICDDEALIVFTPLAAQYRVHPFPTWSDYLMNRCEPTWDVQYSVPLWGLFFLEHAETDAALPLDRGEALMRMNESAAQVVRRFLRRMDETDASRVRRVLFENAHRLATAVPAYRLGVQLDGMFWKEIQKVMDG